MALQILYFYVFSTISMRLHKLQYLLHGLPIYVKRLTSLYGPTLPKMTPSTCKYSETRHKKTHKCSTKLSIAAKVQQNSKRWVRASVQWLVSALHSDISLARVS
jgi:hypothetical protein